PAAPAAAGDAGRPAPHAASPLTEPVIMRVIVTGAANGIGRATALRFARAGADVIAVDVDDHGLAASRQRQATGSSPRTRTSRERRRLRVPSRRPCAGSPGSTSWSRT